MIQMIDPIYSNHMTKLEFCLLSNNIMDYYVVSQGKTSIPGVDDGEECELTDVRSLIHMRQVFHKKFQ